MKLTIGYFYPKLLNLYGDDGNVQILKDRAEKRGIEVEVLEITPDTLLDDEMKNRINLVFMGGGPDSSQKGMYEDLVKNKGPFLKKYIENNGVGLFICGSYQLLGKYYKSANGDKLDGLGIFDLYTEHPGKNKERCIGNVVCEINKSLLEDPVFKNVNNVGEALVGFENHGGRTFISEDSQNFAKVITGHGNNLEDDTEGLIYRSAIGTYLHGPILSKNPHLADYLIAKALGLNNLERLDDSLIISAHTASRKLK